MTRAVHIAPELVAGVLQSGEGVEVSGLELPPRSWASDGRHHLLVWLRGEAELEVLHSLHDRLSEELARRAVAGTVPYGARAQQLHETLTEHAQKQRERHRGQVSVEVVLERPAWMEAALWSRQDAARTVGLPAPLSVMLQGDEFSYLGLTYRCVRGATPRMEVRVDGKLVEEVSLQLAFAKARGGR